ncbi:Aste57867_19163 [Aphanomyces stellatus]|uniref:Aste57867_19163 protein n=1 Tax=Aphanomyces stellatus TaxID=120398 RepID=A0A485LDW6_9STRA|nr:hypothetical protein As57867_019099 [Aphanomyces stellatus]VFT95885.1 Aste57867_19163 [Aphanomyces stellatus]
MQVVLVFVCLVLLALASPSVRMLPPRSEQPSRVGCDCSCLSGIKWTNCRVHMIPPSGDDNGADGENARHSTTIYLRCTTEVPTTPPAATPTPAATTPATTPFRTTQSTPQEGLTPAEPPGPSNREVQREPPVGPSTTATSPDAPTGQTDGSIACTKSHAMESEATHSPSIATS